jgi:hypothetical protein
MSSTPFTAVDEKRFMDTVWSRIAPLGTLEWSIPSTCSGVLLTTYYIMFSVLRTRLLLRSSREEVEKGGIDINSETIMIPHTAVMSCRYGTNE